MSASGAIFAKSNKLLMSINHWIAAARLRTLPLAFASIILGTFLAASQGHFDPFIFILTLLTTLLYQVLSNYANDYGDGVKGTDAQREGEQRAVGSGLISAAQMKRGVWIFALLSLLSGTILSIWATWQLPWPVTLTFVVLGMAAVGAAITYTVGKNAYGYHGLGDVAVLLFFGVIGVGGSYFLQTNTFSWEIFLPAAAMGLLAAGVLNLNNMRDRLSDARAGKRTLVVWLGERRAKLYHVLLLLSAFDAAFFYNLLQPSLNWWGYLFLICLPLLGINARQVLRSEEPAHYEPLLKQLALTALLFSFTFGLGQVL